MTKFGLEAKIVPWPSPSAALTVKCPLAVGACRRTLRLAALGREGHRTARVSWAPTEERISSCAFTGCSTCRLKGWGGLTRGCGTEVLTSVFPDSTTARHFLT